MTDKPPVKPATRDDLFRFLEGLGIKTTTVDHEPVHTVAESSKLERELPGGHTKNLFLKDAKGQLFLVIAKSTADVNLKGLHRRIGAARLSFGKPELMIEALGVQPGSVTAFALINDSKRKVRVILDRALIEDDSINCHPLENTATTNIGREDLLRFIHACGHEPTIINLGE